MWVCFDCLLGVFDYCLSWIRFGVLFGFVLSIVTGYSICFVSACLLFLFVDLCCLLFCLWFCLVVWVICAWSLLFVGLVLFVLFDLIVVCYYLCLLVGLVVVAC